MRWKKRRPNKIRFAHFLLAFTSRRFAEWPMSIKVHWKNVLNLKLKGKVKNWSFWIKKVANVFINFLFQYNILPTFRLSKMRSRLWAPLLNILISRHKSSKKQNSVYNQTTWLVTLSKEGIKLKNIFSSDKIRFHHTVFHFFFHPKLVDKVNIYGPKIKKGHRLPGGERGGGSTLSYFA